MNKIITAISVSDNIIRIIKFHPWINTDLNNITCILYVVEDRSVFVRSMKNFGNKDRNIANEKTRSIKTITTIKEVSNEIVLSRKPKTGGVGYF